MPVAERTIDLSPAVLGQIEHRGNDVALVFPKQACYSDARGDAPRVVPYFHCEMQLEQAHIEQYPDVLPFEADEWRLNFRGGSRGSLLPIGFEAEGPIELILGLDSASRAVVTAKRFRFVVHSQVATEEQWPAT